MPAHVARVPLDERRPRAAGVTARWGAQPAATRRRLVGAALVSALLVPLVAALVALHSPRWYPLNDLAQTEMRLRDVGTADPPLVGLVGRMHHDGVQGSHPGPLGFFAMWPVYRLAGASAWAMIAASLWVHAVALAACTWIAFRRGGARLALLVAAALAVLSAAYGVDLLAVAWNPYLPLLPWVAFLLAVWSVLDDDVWLLPVVVAAGSLCAQTHIGYLATTAALTGIALGWSFVTARRRAALREWSRPALVAAGLGAVLWFPPLVEQLTESPGNATILWHYLSSPEEPVLGLRRGLRVVLVHLNPWRLVTGDIVRSLGAPGEAQRRTVGASLWPGVVLLLTWAAAVVVTWRVRHRQLLLLHATLAAALVLAVVNLSRVLGLLWYYLALWAWGLTALVLVAIAATVGVALRDRPAALRTGAVALTAVLVVATASFVADAGDAELSERFATSALDAVVPPTAAALGNEPGPMLVTWGDPVYLGSQGWSLANELHREGFDVGLEGHYHGGVMAYRRLAPHDARTEVHLSVGSDIERWRHDPDAEEVAFFDPRDEREEAEFQRLRREVVTGLEDAGRANLVPLVDASLSLVGLESSVPTDVRRKVERMSELGAPTAVFVVR